MTKLTLTKGDITQLKVDIIVNAANSSLLGGGGVDGAIHRAAGPGLLSECKALGGCPVGEAKITSGYNLLAKFVIHTVGPVWHGGDNGEERLLRNCYHNCLNIAENLKLHTIAFPNISTGVYGFPKQKAAETALHEVNEFIQKAEFLEEVIFVTFDNENYKIYAKLLSIK
jgi:O-acetyl-ADP-ribose deacetylase (regulator of RNase III)